MNHTVNIRAKIVTREDLLSRLEGFRKDGRTVGFTNGCFDIIHMGHIDYLNKASALADLLVVGLNSDASVKKIKGPDRPLQVQDSRALVLASMVFIDFVVIFSEETPYNLISLIRPDVLVKGGDYQKDEIVGRDVVEKAGGRVVTIPFISGHSSSSLISKLDEI